VPRRDHERRALDTREAQAVRDDRDAVVAPFRRAARKPAAQQLELVAA